jgi:hypothetical protein
LSLARPLAVVATPWRIEWREVLRKLPWIKRWHGLTVYLAVNLIQVRNDMVMARYRSPTTSRREDMHMYWDDAVIFGLVTVAMMIAFLGGWIAFIVRDHRRKKH